MMIQPIPKHFLLQLRQYDRRVSALEAAINSEMSAGRLKPGDPISTPERLAVKLKLSPVEVLESVSELLARGVLRQNWEGDLFIAEPSSQPKAIHTPQQVA